MGRKTSVPRAADERDFFMSAAETRDYGLIEGHGRPAATNGAATRGAEEERR